MDKINPVREVEKNEKVDWFDPYYMGDGVMRCCCGFELIKEDENTFKCTGGSHRYLFSNDEAFIDKFGNLMLKNDEGNKANQ